MSDGEGSSTERTAVAPGDTSLLEGIRDWLRNRRGRNGEALRDTIEELIEERADAAIDIDADERALIKNILNLHEQTVEDVMVPRADIVAVDARSSVEDSLAVLVDAGHSRCPVYRGTLDDTVGMIHLKDLLPILAGRQKTLNLAKMARRVLFVAPSMRVLDLLLQMRGAHIHMALVVDEYGGIDGLVTIEDLVEEIVGDIEDEHDTREAAMLSEDADGTLLADARLTIEEFEEQVGVVLDEADREELDTVGGLVFSLAGRVPGRGEIVSHPSGVEFEIVDADPRRVRRLRIHRPTAKPAGD